MRYYIDFISTVSALTLALTILIIYKLNKMANELEDLTAEVVETKGIMASAKVLIEGFAELLRNAGTDPVKLRALQNDLDTSSTDLANAITANPLPTDPPPPPPPPVDPPTEGRRGR